MLARITTGLQARFDLASAVKSVSQMVVDFAGVDERPKAIAIRYAVCSNLGPTVVIPASEICSEFQFSNAVFIERATVISRSNSCIPRRLGRLPVQPISTEEGVQK